jgi:hypothetical protein
MTLSELAAFVCNKVSDTDAASVAVCKEFLNVRYKMIWDGFLWTETLGVVEKAVAQGDTEVVLDSAPSITFFQSSSVPETFIDFPVAMRFTADTEDDGTEMLGYDWQRFFQIDPNSWNDVDHRQSRPTNFINLPRNGTGNARIKPVPVPSEAGTIYVLGKLKWVALGDDDSPCLRGIDNALLAFGEADMLERARQYGKAKMKTDEAGVQVGIMKDIEKGQQQSISVITPMEEGYFDPTGGPL